MTARPPLVVTPLAIPDVKRVALVPHADDRGSFCEVWNRAAFARVGLEADFVQDNEVVSRRGVLRGLHYQCPRPQGKLVRCVRGHIFDVAVDLRRSSPTFGAHAALELHEDRPDALWIPRGFAHGYLALSEVAVVQYKMDEAFVPEVEHSIRWDDPDLAIPWPVDRVETLVVSGRDQRAGAFGGAVVFG